MSERKDAILESLDEVLQSIAEVKALMATTGPDTVLIPFRGVIDIMPMISGGKRYTLRLVRRHDGEGVQFPFEAEEGFPEEQALNMLYEHARHDIMDAIIEWAEKNREPIAVQRVVTEDTPPVCGIVFTRRNAEMRCGLTEGHPGQHYGQSVDAKETE